MDKLKQAEELRRVNTVWNKIIQRIKINLGIDSNEKPVSNDMIDFIVKDEWEKENERSSSNN
jgi:hypothetical protein